MRIWAILLVSVVAMGPSGFVSAQALPSRPTIGLALSGGSAKGIAHVGVLRAVERLGVEVDVVAGTSMGSVVGGLYAMGLPVDSVESIIRAADWAALIGDDVSRDARSVEQRRLDERTILSVPLDALRITLPTGAIVGSNVIRLLESVTWQAATERDFSQLPRPFVAVATDLETGEPVPLRGGVLSEALRASVGIPAIVEPLSIDGRLLVDGAVSRNLPAQDARDLGADFVICSDVSDPLDSAEDLRSLLDVFTQITSLGMLAATIEQRALCDVLIRPDVDGISPLSFEEVSDWVTRGDTAVAPHAERLRQLVREVPSRGFPPRPFDLLADSVRVVALVVQGSDDPRVTGLVREQLGVVVDDWVTKERMEARLADLDATGLFHLVRYRIDRPASGAGVNLVVTVQEGARDRLGVGLRYDDEYRAALLFAATLHNRLIYGSVARVDLRVGEETRIGATLRRRRGVTGNVGLGLFGSWNQSELSVAGGARHGIELLRGGVSLSAAPTRGTAVSLELTREQTNADIPTQDFTSVSVVLNHETLDRIDYPRAGADARGRVEVGIDFASAVFDGRYYVPLHGRVTADVGVWIGYQGGEVIPIQRRFALGGAHPSAVFGVHHGLFHGLGRQEHSGRAVQVGRLGLRFRLTASGYVRAGMDVGAVREAWRLPLERPMTGWAVSAGSATPIGPVELQLSKVWGERHDPRLSIGVGRRF